MISKKSLSKVFGREVIDYYIGDNRVHIDFTEGGYERLSIHTLANKCKVWLWETYRVELNIEAFRLFIEDRTGGMRSFRADTKVVAPFVLFVDEVIPYDSRLEILACHWAIENYGESDMSKAIVNVPMGAGEEAADGSKALIEMFAMNGEEIVLIDEGSYRGDFGIDWDMYDYVSVAPGGNYYSWKKEWLKR